MGPWTKRFFETTRGRLVSLLRRRTMTVEELASAVGVTDNAVRAQLAALERDGLVRQRGTVKGAGKPSFTYELTPEVEPSLSRAYLSLFDALADTLEERLDPAALEALLREAGRRAASRVPVPSGDPAARARAAAAILVELGGLAEAVQSSGRWTIESDGCPLSAMVGKHPALCRAVESMLSELTAQPVRECCDRAGERPRCRFELGSA
ncbi:MAG TPA: ArsR family transcriptional regulator [Gemmatimonadales bacterium]|nr:ArsR family transcriptional regulator [Gemmatimonadales bacterium]